MISLRGQELKLLALRGRFAVGNKPLSGLTLAEGQKISFARGLTLTVEEIVLPDSVMALSIGGPPQILLGATTIQTNPDGLRLIAGYREGAAALVWNRDDRWRIRIGEAEPVDLLSDSTHTINGHTATAVALPLSQLGSGATRLAGAITSPLRLVVQFDAAQIHRESEPILVLSGISARILSELVAFGGPVGWAVLAGEVWPHIEDRNRLRKQLDVSLTRLRKKLARGLIRADLVNSDGTGKLSLVLAEGDRIEDKG